MPGSEERVRAAQHQSLVFVWVLMLAGLMPVGWIIKLLQHLVKPICVPHLGCPEVLYSFGQRNGSSLDSYAIGG